MTIIAFASFSVDRNVAVNVGSCPCHVLGRVVSFRHICQGNVARERHQTGSCCKIDGTLIFVCFSDRSSGTHWCNGLGCRKLVLIEIHGVLYSNNYLYSSKLTHLLLRLFLCLFGSIDLHSKFSDF